VAGQREGDGLGQRDISHLPALGRGEDGLVVEQLHLPDDVYDAAEKVDVLDSQAEHFPLAKAAPGSGVHECSIASRQGSPHSLDPIGSPRLDVARI
jgi:hypothetical protein